MGNIIMKNKSEDYQKKYRVLREVIVIIIILIISAFLSVPSYLSQVKEYNNIKKDDGKVSPPKEQKADVNLLKSADKYITTTNASSFLKGA